MGRRGSIFLLFGTLSFFVTLYLHFFAPSARRIDAAWPRPSPSAGTTTVRDFTAERISLAKSLQANDAPDAQPRPVSQPHAGSIVFQHPTDPVSVSASSSLLRDPFTPSSAIRKPCGSHIERNMHFVDRSFWHAIKPETMREKRREWQDYLMHQVPTYDYKSFRYSGRGVVYTVSGRTLARALASVQLLRHHYCKLPVQFWYLAGELNENHLDRIRAFNITAKDLTEDQKRFQQFDGFAVGHAYGYSRNYQIKTMVLLLSEFDEVLYLDSDNMPLRNPETLFSSREYLETGALFWPDYWKFPEDNPMWQITEQQCEDEWEQESGQLILHKEKSWRALWISLFFQKDHEFYFRIILGDKDTFRFGWKVTGTPYHLIQHPASIAGRIRQGRFCGHTMIQHSLDGEILFAHTTTMKTTNALREGNTWEAIQYFTRADAIPLKAELNGRTIQYLVSYPSTLEYSGGIEKTSEKGGIGTEAFNNPCMNMVMESVTLSTQTELVDRYGIERTVDSYKINTELLDTYRGGSFRWFESKYYEFGGPGSNYDGTCGNGVRGNGLCSNPDDCCSAWGWCGVTLDHCGVGCHGGPCFHSRSLPANPAPDFEYCGNGNVGFGLCKVKGECCSRFGWCGQSPDHCDKANCVSGPCSAESKEQKK